METYKAVRNWPYNTDRWQALRSAQLARQPVCEVCQSWQALEVHHRNPLTRMQKQMKDERAAYPPPTLLSTLCKSCHSKITGGRKLPFTSCQWQALLNEDL